MYVNRNYRNKMKNNKYNTVGSLLNSNIKTIKRDNIYIPP